MIPMLWERNYPGDVERTDHHRGKPLARLTYVTRLESGPRVATAAALANAKRERGGP